MTKKTLAQLQADIAKAKAVNDNQAKAIVELQEQIQRSMDDTEEHPMLIEILNRSISTFQAEYPQLALSMRSAVEILSKGGI